MCFVCEWLVDLVVKSVLPVVASIRRQVYLQKQLPLCLAEPSPLLSTLDQWSEITRWLACFCHCNEAKPRPEVSAVRFPNTLCMLKPLPPWNVPIPPAPPTTNPTPFFSSNSSKWVWIHLAFYPLPPPAFTASFFYVHKETLPHLDCLYAVVKTETAAGCECQRRGRESITPIPALCVKLQSNCGDRCVLSGPKVPLLGNKPHRTPLSLSS